MLGRRADGQLLSGAAREQGVDPFTHQMQGGRRWAEAYFRFGDGAGLVEYDGSHRYKSGEFVDTRGGFLLPGPERTLCDARGDTERIYDEGMTLSDVECSTGNFTAHAERFQVPAGKTNIRRVAVLVRREEGTDYTGAANFTVGITVDAAGPKPGAAAGTRAISPIAETDVWLAFDDRWRNGEYFWLEVVFNANVAVTAGNWYWIYVWNNQAPEIYWAETDRGGGTAQTRSRYAAGAWVNGYSDYPLMFKIKYWDEIDAFPRSFCKFRGVDNVERLFACVGVKTMYWDEATATWIGSVVLAAGTTEGWGLLEFNSHMFAYGGIGVNSTYYDGTTPTTNWVGAGVVMTALAVHDNLLWKSDGRTVMGSTTGLVGSWTANSVAVGDPGTNVESLQSHGGKLFAGKREGIYEISYPDTYPTTGTPTANLVLDFRTERGKRQWMLDWHSGLYFPGLSGVNEYKSGVLRNIWTEKVDDGAQEIVDAERTFSRPRRWARLYDSMPGVWVHGHGNTRGMTFAYSSPHLHAAELWWYDAANWHPMGPLAERVGSGLNYLEEGEYCLSSYLEDLGGGRGRLWYGYGWNIGYMNVPVWTKNRLQDEDADYFDGYGCWIYTPDFVVDEGRAEVDYVGLGLKLINAGAGAGGSVYVFYRMD